MNSIILFLDTETEVAYELVAEPVQELPAGDQQPGEAVESAPEESITPLTCKASPGAYPLF